MSTDYSRCGFFKTSAMTGLAAGLASMLSAGDGLTGRSFPVSEKERNLVFYSRVIRLPMATEAGTKIRTMSWVIDMHIILPYLTKPFIVLLINTGFGMASIPPYSGMN